MTVFINNKNPVPLRFRAEGREMRIDPFASERVPLCEGGELTFAVCIDEPSAVVKRKRRVYHRYLLTVESEYRFSDVRDGDAFSITLKERDAHTAICTVYRKPFVETPRSLPFSETVRVIGDGDALRKQFRKDERKDAILAFFLNPLIELFVEFSLGNTLLIALAVFLFVWMLGWTVFFKFFFLIYLAIAALEWITERVMEKLFPSLAEPKPHERFDEAFLPEVIVGFCNAADPVPFSERLGGWFAKLFGKRKK